MASLVMTIDSDSEHPNQKQQQAQTKGNQKNKNKVLKKPIIPKTEEEEDIILGQAINIDYDSEDISMNNTNQDQKKGMWNFQDSLKTDKGYLQSQKQDMTQGEYDDLEAKKPLTLEERIKQKLEEFDINMTDFDLEQKKPQTFKPEPKANAKVHYDKEDLISFHQLFISKPLVKACNDLEYEHPTVIQRKVIPAISEGNDILAHAVTGSGKTAAYLLPILEKYLRLRQTSRGEIGKVRYLILQPTRELAAQCHSMLQNLSKYVPSFNSCSIIGGSSMKQQQRDLANLPDCIVATTGRLLDHLQNTKGFSFEDVEILVLDEADKLLEMGFKDELMQIIKHCTNLKRQTLMVSATLTQDIKELAQLALKQPLQFTVSQQQRLADIASLRLTQYLVRLHEDQIQGSGKIKTKKKKPVKAINQEQPEIVENQEEVESENQDSDSQIEEDEENQQSEASNNGMDEGSEDNADDSADESDDSEKPKKFKKKQPKNDDVDIKDVFLIKREAILLNLVMKHFTSRAIVFFNEKVQVSRMLTLFTIFGLKAAQVQGNMSQEDRLSSIEKFQKGEVDFLLATDLLARGLDISSIRTVINFSFPNEPKRYLHRIGRTARAGSHGIAITICNDEERKELKKLTRKMGQQVQTFTLQNKQIQKLQDKIFEDLDDIAKEITIEQQQDQEMSKAFMETQKAENMIKYKDDIMNKPKRSWMMNAQQKQNLKEKSKEDLKNIRSKFDEQLNQQAKNSQKNKRKRDQKLEDKEALKQDKQFKKRQVIPGQSRFEQDWEKDKKEQKNNMQKPFDQKFGKPNHQQNQIRKPFDKNQNNEAKPFDQNQKRGRQPFDKNQNRRQKPFGKDQQNGQKPFDKSQGNREKPFVRGLNTGQKPFERSQSRGQKPFDKSRGQKPFDKSQNRGQKPFERSQSRGQKPFERSQSKGQKPFERKGEKRFDRSLSQGQKPFDTNQNKGQKPFEKSQGRGQKPFERKGEKRFDRSLSKGQKPSFNNDKKRGFKPTGNQKNKKFDNKRQKHSHH